jgi:hypothetical protein
MVVERGVWATGRLGAAGAPEDLGVADGVRAAVATGAVSGGLAATGAALWQAAVQSKLAQPKRVKAVCFMVSSNLHPQ